MMLNSLVKIFLGFFLFLVSTLTFSAHKVSYHTNTSYSLPLYVKFINTTSRNVSFENFQERSRSYDFNQTLHIRFHEMYGKYLIWGTNAIIHIPKQKLGNTSLDFVIKNAKNYSVNGTLYNELNRDLTNAPTYVFSNTQLNKAKHHAIYLYQHKTGYTSAIVKNASLIIYIDNNSIAHWAFHVQLSAKPLHKFPSKPNYIIDAITFKKIHSWNSDINFSTVSAGGFGGNFKVGKLKYDNLAATGHLPAFKLYRDDDRQLCYLENDEVVIKDMRKDFARVTFTCNKHSSEHNNLYWNNNTDEINGGYSPANDAMYAATVTNKAFKTWYNIPITTNPKKLILAINFFDGGGEDIDDATYGDDGKDNAVLIGNGLKESYPWSSLDIIAHEFGHGFTVEHSNLSLLYNHSSALNESFSDMTAKAVEYFVNGHNDWYIGKSTIKDNDKALRYMHNPILDCYGRKAGDQCSVDNAKDFPYLDYEDPHYGNPHFGAGVTNKAFYLLATSKGWNTKKAYDIMVKANMHYWISNTTFLEAACGVVRAAEDYRYPLEDVHQAFAAVGIDTRKC